MAQVTVTAVVDDHGLDRWVRPRADVVVEHAPERAPDAIQRPDTTGGGTWHFGTVRGPFRDYARTLTATAPDAGGTRTVTQVTTYRLGLGPWSAVFALPMRRLLARPGGRTPWWAPPAVLDRAGASALASLATLSVIGGYLGTLISQTLTYAADEFGAGERAQGDTFAAVRVGVLLALVVAARADRHGRRRALLAATTGALVATVATALSPELWVLAAVQTIARGLATAIGLLIVVVAAEELPAGSRAFGVSLLTMTAGLGAGMVLWLLPVVEVDVRAWRLLYVAPLLFLPALHYTGSVLVESRRFVPGNRAGRPPPGAPRPGRGRHARRLALLAATALAMAAFASPASQLQNEFLRETHDFSAARITAFTLLTVTPSGLGIVVGGRLADLRGRRLIGGIGVAGGTIFGVAQFLTPSEPVLWLSSLAGSIVAGMAVPALSVYGPELFPTGLRSEANAVITTLGVLGSVIGLLAVGRLAERWELGPAIASMGVAPALVVFVLLPRFPETARIELEDLNPEDRT